MQYNDKERIKNQWRGSHDLNMKYMGETQILNSNKQVVTPHSSAASVLSYN